MLPQLVIVADDLTGAADSAARCRQAGLQTVVLLDTSQWPAGDEMPAALALSTDSRHLPPETAAARVKAALAQAGAWPQAVWCKKIDSTLRGNLGAELDAMLDWLGDDRPAVVCPAFPAQGRGLEEGYLVYAETPPREVHLPSLLRSQSNRVVAEIPLAAVRAGAVALTQLLADEASGGAQLLVVDALDEVDLQTIAEATAAALGAAVYCGSAGLVGVVAARIAAQQPSAAVEPETGQPPGAGAILGVVGSGSAMAHAQIAQVAARPDVRVRTLDRTWSKVDVVNANGHPTGHWLVHLAPPPPGLALEGATARAEAARLADLSQVVVARLHPTALIVVGGDTANYVMRVLGIRRLAVVEELLPGVPLMTGVDDQGVQRWVVLKPGSFGDVATLGHLYDLVRARQVDVAH
jgi:uncharacterized protein YgbK (DUF1537 family)